MKVEIPATLKLGASKRTNSSMDLRRMPVEDNFLFQFSPSSSVRTTGSAFSIRDADLQSVVSRTTKGAEEALATAMEKTQFLRALCLRSKYCLRTQLLLSFGLITTLTIGFVIGTCIVVAIVAGNSIQQIHQDSLKEYLTNIEATSARFLAEQLSPKLIPTGAVNILYEATLDRFAGYPFVNSDAVVPFLDQISGTGRYPLQGTPLPLDWETHNSPPVTEETYKEHLQHPQRWEQMYKNIPFVSTATAFFAMQGICDPEELDPNSLTYANNCTFEQNDITTGGTISPTPLNSVIHRKGSDLAPLLKSLYEYHTDLKDIGIFFANGGAGAEVTFPHYLIDSSVTYVSTGCDWMASPNPMLVPKNNTTQPIATLEERQRCHSNGTTVPAREYNVLERKWCQQQALDPNRIHVDGPYFDAWSNLQLMTVGRSVYDRVTHELVACLYFGFTLSNVQQTIEQNTQASNPQINGTMETTVVRWDEHGTVVATSSEESNSSEISTIDQLNVGVTPELYQQVYTLVDFDEASWDPQEIQQAYEALRLQNDGAYLSAYPIPPIPETYDPYYRPEFLVVTSLYQDAISMHVEDVNNEVDEQVQDVIKNCVIVGLTGLAIVLVVIFIMAHSITMPLQRMDQQARNILGSFGGMQNDDDDDGLETVEREGSLEKRKQDSSSTAMENENSMEKPGSERATISTSRCTPRTELAKLTEAFESMVASFSGTSSMSRATKHVAKDVENTFLLGNEKIFQELYQSRQEPGFKYQISITDEGMGHDSEEPFIHPGHIVVRKDDDLSEEPMEQPEVTPWKGEREKEKQHDKPASSLFLWIVLLIGTPLLLITLGISADVLYRISNEFLAGIDDAKDLYIDIEVEALAAYTRSRAALASSLTAESVRDLHILARYASWLQFGGIETRDSFTKMTSGSEACKNEDDYRDCDYFKESYVCDCAWNDITTGGDCQDYDADTRYLQQVAYSAQLDDAFADGDRNISTYPSNSNYPNETNWWLEYDKMPGSEKGPIAEGHDTTYERTRMAAANPMILVLYNYDVAKHHALSSFIAYEADGLMVGFNGCRANTNAKRPFWKSSESNGGALLRPELCPLGKYGYDPRCREWYDTGRELAMEEDGALYITPPYKFTSADIYAHSATKPLIDPNTKEHVGQVLIDFRSDPIYRALEEQTPLAKGGFPILITSRKDEVAKAETVIGPGFTRGESTKPIVKVVLPQEQNCTEGSCKANIKAFRSIVQDMQQGEINSTVFHRLRVDGSQETVFFSHAPVVVKSYRPVNSSEFARGVEEAEYIVYSLGLAETEEGALEPFEAVEKSTEKQVYIAIAVLSIAIVLALVAVVYLSRLVATSITEPMLFLYDLIMSIKTSIDSQDNSHKLDQYKGSGSKELVNFSVTLHTLHSVVSNVNTAYYAGDLDKAYYVMLDSLRLFRRLDNKKAIGVACNNLGNILFAGMRRMQRRGEKTLFGRSLSTVVTKGVGYFTEAIRLGEKAYDDFYEAEGWTPNCLAFMQHLSNRYFNRAMFLLAVKDEHKEPEELERLGLRDLQIAFDMDVEITDQGEETGWGRVDRDQQLLEVALLRARGHILLQELGYPDDWEVEETLDKAFKLVKTASARPTQSGMFADIGPVGRFQQIETELMRYKSLKGDTATAAKIAIRLLKEDEYVFPRAFVVAMKVLTSYVKEQKGPPEGQKEDEEELDDPLLYGMELAMDDLLATIQAQELRSMEDGENEELGVVRNSMKNREMGQFIDCSLEDYRAMDSVTMEDF